MVGEFDAYVQDEQEKSARAQYDNYLATVDKFMETPVSFEDFCDQLQTRDSE